MIRKLKKQFHQQHKKRKYLDANSTNEMNYQASEISKTLMKDAKEDENERTWSLCSQFGRINIVRIVKLHRTSSELTWFYQSINDILHRKSKDNPKIHMESGRFWEVEANLSRKNKLYITLPDLKMYNELIKSKQHRPGIRAELVTGGIG